MRDAARLNVLPDSEQRRTPERFHSGFEITVGSSAGIPRIAYGWSGARAA
jgi:hypothetical protein